jgi:DNA-binding winged helix-turn-helix (wHTH) protein/Tol biopolymer transport system component
MFLTKGPSKEDPVTNLLSFGAFQLDLRARELRKHGLKIGLPEQSIQVLAILLERPGQVVLREEIQKKLWPHDTIVEFDQSINAAVKRLRRALGDEAETPRYIETLPRRGYRFIYPVDVRVGLATVLTAPPEAPRGAGEEGRSAVGVVQGRDEGRPDRELPDREARLEGAWANVSPDRWQEVKRVLSAALAVDGASRSGTANREHGLDARVTPGKTRALRRWRVMVAVTTLVLAAGAGMAWLLTRDRHVQSKLNERQITANPPENFVTGAAISPDGKHIAYHDQTGLYVRSIDTGETHALSLPAGLQTQIWRVQWFPDGGKLLAVASSPDGVDLWVITILGEAPPRLLYRHAALPAISPDDQLVAFVNFNLKTGEIFQEVRVGGIGGEAPRTVATAEPHSLISPVWSPDGRWIAYARRWNTAGVEVLPAGGGPAKTIVSDSSLPEQTSPCFATFSCLSWLPDWRLVFSAGQAGGARSAQSKYSLWTVHIEPRKGEAVGRLERLAEWSDLGTHLPPSDLSVTADGKRLSFLKTQQWYDVYLGELGPDGASMRPPRRFTLDNRGIRSLDSWTPDSQAIVFSSDRNGRQEIFRQGLNESVGEVVVQDSEDNYDAVLTPDGAWALYVAAKRGALGAQDFTQRLMRRPANGGSPDLVLEEPAGHPLDYRCPRKSSSRCVLLRRDGKDLVFYSLDPVQGKGQQLGRIQTSASARSDVSWSVSPDGSRLAYVPGTEEYKGRIEVLALRNHAWHEVSLEPGWGDLQSVAWAADGNGFFVTSWLPDSFDLLHVTLTGKVKPLLRNGHRQWIVGALPSPNGKYLALMAQTTDSNVWMLENF